MKSTQAELQFRLFKERAFIGLISALSGLVLLPLGFIFAYVFKRGIKAINWDFFTQLPVPVGEMGGGVLNAIAGSVMIVSVAALIAIPLGVLSGVFLVEKPDHKFAELSRLCIDTFQGTPSIVMGIIAYSWIVRPLGQFSAISGSVALALIMLPVIAKATEETVKMIPDSLREASYALGVPYYKTVFKVVIPAAKNGIVSSILLGVSRITGETAPLLFTAFGSPFLILSPFKAVNSLPLLIFNYATSPYAQWQELAWGASLILIVFILALSLISRFLERE